MKRKYLTITTIVLFTIGVGSALYILYDYLYESINNSRLIEKEEALSIAIESGRWDKNLLNDKTIDVKLLHIKNDGFAFEVDKKTLEDGKLFMTKLPEFENQYVWIIQIAMIGGSNKNWNYIIDASSGELLNQKQELITIGPVDPDTSIKNNIPITQAKGNVTVVFPYGISEDKQKSSPFPAQLIITKTDTVTWFNNDTVVHTVTSGYPEQDDFAGQMFDSGLISPQSSFSYIFSDERITGYSYFCSVHPWMRGQIVVVK